MKQKDRISVLAALTFAGHLKGKDREQHLTNVRAAINTATANVRQHNERIAKAA